MSEKNLPATKKRLDEARKKGQVAQTPAIPQTLAAVGTFELITMTSDYWLPQGPQLLASFVTRLGETNPATHLTAKDLIVPLGWVGIAVVLVALLFASMLALIGNIMQTGFMVAPEGVAKLERLDPIQHAKQMFSAEQLGQVLMGVVKVAGIMAFACLGLLLSLDSLMRLADGTLMQAAQAVLDMFVLCERLTLVFLVVCVAIDWAIRRHSHFKSLRMSREELENEQKDQFGDKHVRQQRNEMRRDMLAGELTENTRKANVVVTNPTHFAVALFYDPAKYPLPVVLARGADDSAALMRKVAREEGIPIIRSAQLARTLYSVGREWNPVPRVTLKAVAAVFRLLAQVHTGERSIDEDLEIDDATAMGQPRSWTTLNKLSS